MSISTYQRIDPAVEAQQLREWVEQADAAEAAQWFADRNRWARVGEDPAGVSPLEVLFDEELGGLPDHELVRGLPERTRLLLARWWMVAYETPGVRCVFPAVFEDPSACDAASLAWLAAGVEEVGGRA